jgi:hypothetical protein
MKEAAIGTSKKGEDKPATAKQIAEATQRKLEKALISQKAMKENAGHTASQALQSATTVGVAGASSFAVGLTPARHRNKVRTARGIAAAALFLKGLHKALKTGEGEFYMRAADGMAAAELSETAMKMGGELGEKWYGGKNGQGGTYEQAPAQPPVQQAPAQPAAAPQIAMTAQGDFGAVREVLPQDPALAQFRANGRSRR